jgi:glyoxylase-like metal-dependent hydrolase (beta-lactamase superfamily II)
MYNGRVTVGGPAEVHELPQLMISKLAVGPYNNNVYLLRCRATGAQVLVDAASDPGRIMDLIGSEGISMVITTHRHPDHWQALEEVRNLTGALTAAHRDDVEGIPVPTDVVLRDGDAVSVGDCSLEVIQLIGHTPGSIALLYDDPEGPPHLITGDCLFPGGIGRAIGEDNFESLYRGVVEKIFDRFGDETWIYPGHGDDTILGNERPHLAEWWARRW